ncbi:MAG: tetraacyldisaccharide 4'-kinase [Campylobacterales bacterium]|nr:tetraacyldisaccharide 4'-kinase [Campylobacterales bacterium]
MREFFEELLFAPKFYHYPFIILFTPISFLYASLMLLRRIATPKKDFGLPIISVGNLIMGGSGKTPFIIAAASNYQDVCVISRGYGRQSKGLIEVSHQGRILVDVSQSGDEAMLIAQSLPNAWVIVSENRAIAIEKAKQRGAKIIFLDDGFNRVEIKKFEILLEPQSIKNYLPLPAGAFREFYFSSSYANKVVREGKGFRRVVSFENLGSKMLLVSAISNPSRLNQYLPDGVKDRLLFEDHAYFDTQLIKAKMQEMDADKILVTQKDYVKLEKSALPIALMRLHIDIDRGIHKAIDEYIKSF